MSNLVENMKLSKQALGALMMALQKSLLEQSDIVPVLENFDFISKEGDLFVKNAPLVKFDANGQWLEDAADEEEQPDA
jgi:hypothetical protein|tara:strand:- start:1944 stop:2177 length:234 start_codon:yes stop_codon:yes gene_type:complete